MVTKQAQAQLVNLSLSSLTNTNMAILETKDQGWRAISTE